MAYTSVPSNSFTIPGTDPGYIDFRKKASANGGVPGPVTTRVVPAYLAPDGGAGASTYTPTAQQYKHSGINPAVNGRVRPDPLAVAAFATNATALSVQVVSSNNYAESAIVDVSLNGTSIASLNVNPSPGTQTFPLANLPAGDKVLSFNVGGQGRDNEQGDIVFQSFSIAVPSGYTGSFQPVTRSTGESIAFLIDSIGCGARTPNPGRDAYLVQLRFKRPGADISAMGYGALRLINHLATAELRAAEIQGLKARVTGASSPVVVVGAGTNDYAFATATPSQLQSMVQAFFTEAMAAIPGLKCYLMTAAPRSDESANALGFTTPQYRTALASGAIAAGATVIDGTTTFDLSDVDARDGVHYNTASGNAKVATRLNAALGATGAYTITTEQKPELTKYDPNNVGQCRRALFCASNAGEAVEYRFNSTNPNDFQSGNTFSLEGIAPGTYTIESRRVSSPALVISQQVTIYPFYAPLDAGTGTFNSSAYQNPGYRVNAPFATAYLDADGDSNYFERAVPPNTVFTLWGRRQVNIFKVDMTTNSGPKTSFSVAKGGPQDLAIESNIGILYQVTAPAGGLTLRFFKNPDSVAFQFSYIQLTPA